MSPTTTMTVTTTKTVTKAPPPIHGLDYDPSFLSSLPTLLPRPAPHTPIRALSAAQFAKLHLQSLLSHAPDTTLFPFLHGVEGDNEQQNAFFAAAAGRAAIQIPRFRGLIWVACDEEGMPEPQRDDDMSEDDFDSELSSSDIEVDGEAEDEDTFAMDVDTDTRSTTVCPFPFPFPVPAQEKEKQQHMHPVNHRHPNPPPIDTSPSSTARPIPHTDRERSASTSTSNTSSTSPASPAPSALSLSNTPGTPLTAASTPSSPWISNGNGHAHIAGDMKASLLQRTFLTSTLRPRELLRLASGGESFEFVPPEVPDGISLRNFGIQVPIFATLSDIVIYSPTGTTNPAGKRAALALAEKFKQAMEAKVEARRHPRKTTAGSATCYYSSSSEAKSTTIVEEPTERVQYNVFVLDASPEEMRSELSELVVRMEGHAHTDSTDAHVAPDKEPAPPRKPNTVDFTQREKEEMRDLTRASEILTLAPASSAFAPVEVDEHDGPRPFTPELGQVFLGNAGDVPLPDADLPLPPAPGTSDPFTPEHNPGGFDICIECCDAALVPGPPQLRAAEEHLARLEEGWRQRIMLGQGKASEKEKGKATAIPHRPPPHAGVVVHLAFPSATYPVTTGADAIYAFIDFLRRVLMPKSRRGAKVLIYSSDGYTESSVLALCLLMAMRGCSLPEAYVELQVNKKRSFFVYKTDLPLLRRVEARLARDRTAARPVPQNRTTSHTVSQQMPPVLSASYEERQPIGKTPPPGRPRASTSPLLPSLVADHQVWFEDPRFDGSFPSRVLPFLYLGNLNHAANAYMLHALGITHVVSVGECALVPPPEAHAAPQCTPSSGSLWLEEREGRIKVLDIKGVCDDGIDTLAPQLSPICEWIDRAREEGGRVLVHCRVGVSRSATVTIAYVMKHLALPLVDAYLVVRSRRLSVLIQPNMRLLYNLCGWEVQLARERAKDDERHLRAELAGALNWPYLAREVHALNEKYLH